MLDREVSLVFVLAGSEVEEDRFRGKERNNQQWDKIRHYWKKEHQEEGM